MITPYEAQKLVEEGVTFPAIKDNVVFMLNPLEESTYIERTESSDADIVEKRINAIMVILSYLGGKRFKAISKRNINKGKDSQVGVKVKVETPKVDVDSSTDVHKEQALTDETEILVKADWDGIYSVQNYKIAEATAKQYGFDNDNEIQTLLKLRHPSNPNIINKKTYRINTCKDLKDNLKVAENLKVGVSKVVNVGIEANVKTSSDERYSEVFEFEVEFGNTESKQTHKWLYWIVGGIVIIAAGLTIALL